MPAHRRARTLTQSHSSGRRRLAQPRGQRRQEERQVHTARRKSPVWNGAHNRGGTIQEFSISVLQQQFKTVTPMRRPVLAVNHEYIKRSDRSRQL